MTVHAKLIPKLILDELQRSPVQWRAEHGGKHIKLFIGDELVGGICTNGQELPRKAQLNVRSTVRRAISRQTGGNR